MKVLCVSHPFVLKANQALLAEATKRGGWDATLVAPAVWRNEFGKLEFEQSPDFEGRVIPLPVIGKGNIPLHIYRASMASIVRETKPDAVYVYHESYGLATYQVFRACRGTDAAFGFYAFQNKYREYPWPFSRFERHIFEQSDFALPATETALEVLRKKGYSKSAELMPPPVDAAAFENVPRRDGSGLTVGFVGRLVPIKGVDVLIEALAGLPDDVNAVIVGDGPNRPEYEKRAHELGLDGRIAWEGYVPHSELPAAYSLFDVLAVPSRAPLEQWGRVVIESLAAGVPVIAANVGELPNLMRRTGGGWLFEAEDPGALRAAIEEVRQSRDEARRRADQGQKVAVSEYGVATLAERLVDVVEKAVAEKRR